MSEGSDEGVGFCWAAYRFDAPTNILVVNGCHWACPYEYRFFDFSDPMAGWPQIEADGTVEGDEKEPDIEGDIVRCYRTRDPDDDEGDTDEGAGEEARPDPCGRRGRPSAGRVPGS